MYVAQLTKGSNKESADTPPFISNSCENSPLRVIARAVLTAISSPEALFTSSTGDGLRFFHSLFCGILYIFIHPMAGIIEVKQFTSIINGNEPFHIYLP
jgi:hypothetical protein